MKFKIQNSKFKINLNAKFQIPKQKFCHLSFGFCHSFVIWILSFVIFLTGCDAFVRKFTRKPKKQVVSQEEMVLVPEEYKGPEMTKEELYRQYFLFWKSWHTELVESLLARRSQKKKIDCLEEAIKNLLNLKALLNEEKQKKLDTYIAQLNALKMRISKDIYGSGRDNDIEFSERLKRDILRDFSYAKVKDSLI